MSAALTVQYHRSTLRKSLFGYALRVMVTDAVDMPAEVFIYQRGAAPAPSPGDVATDQFVCIADPVDLEEVPALVPDLANEMPYYRTSEVTLSFRNLDELQDTETDIAADLALLVRSVNAMADFTLTTEVTYD